jgi:hypothetical protein
MDTVFTVIQAFLVIAFTLGGLAQVFVPYERYKNFPFQGWTNDFKPWHLKLIGLIKISATLGMIAGLFMPSLALLVPLGALAIAFIMAGAIATHLRRLEYGIILGNLVYLAFAVFVAYGNLVGVTV